MKRITFLLALLLLLPLTSCGGPTAPPLFSYPFTAAAEVTVDGRAYTVEITVDADGSGAVRYLAPALLSGTVFTVDADGTFLSCGDLVLPVSLPADADPLMLLTVLSLQNADLSAVSVAGETNLLTFRVKGGTVQLAMDPDTGRAVEATASLLGHTVIAKRLSFSRPGG